MNRTSVRGTGEEVVMAKQVVVYIARTVDLRVIGVFAYKADALKYGDPTKLVEASVEPKQS